MGLSQATLNPQITAEVALGTPQGLSISSLPQKVVQAHSTVTCPPTTSYMRPSNYEHNAKEELHLLQEKKPKVTAL
jgi:hypothetical protein